MGERRSLRSLAQGFAVASWLGTGFAVAVAIGVSSGMAIDRALGWRPFAFTVALGMAGGTAGFVIVMRALRSRNERPK